MTISVTWQLRVAQFLRCFFLPHSLNFKACLGLGNMSHMTMTMIIQMEIMIKMVMKLQRRKTRITMLVPSQVIAEQKQRRVERQVRFDRGGAPEVDALGPRAQREEWRYLSKRQESKGAKLLSPLSLVKVWLGFSPWWSSPFPLHEEGETGWVWCLSSI